MVIWEPNAPGHRGYGLFDDSGSPPLPYEYSRKDGLHATCVTVCKAATEETIETATRYGEIGPLGVLRQPFRRES